MLCHLLTQVWKSTNYFDTAFFCPVSSISFALENENKTSLLRIKKQLTYTTSICSKATLKTESLLRLQLSGYSHPFACRDWVCTYNPLDASVWCVCMSVLCVLNRISLLLEGTVLGHMGSGCEWTVSSNLYCELTLFLMRVVQDRKQQSTLCPLSWHSQLQEDTPVSRKTIPSMSQGSKVHFGSENRDNSRGRSDVCTPEPISEWRNFRFPHAFIRKPHTPAWWSINYAPYCGLRVECLYIKLTDKSPGLISYKGLSLNK